MSGAAKKLVIRNIGLLLSGKLEQPILDADCIVCLDGRIAGIGREGDLDLEGADTLVDAKGVTLAPGTVVVERAGVYRDTEPGHVYAGNPATSTGPRVGDDT